jgi:hypothetical protein
VGNGPSNNRIVSEIDYFENLYPNWQPTPSKFGLSAAQVTAVADATTSARQAYLAAQKSRETAKAATTQQREALRGMKRTGSNLIEIVKAFIEQSGDPSLWAQAGLQPPAPRGTVPPPNAPTDLSAGLDSQGNITLRWKSSQPAGASGTVFSIYRGLNNAEPTLLETVGGRSFTDESVPAGVGSVAYAVRAKRSSKQSAFSPSLLLRFGRGSEGQLTLKSVKLAA